MCEINVKKSILEIVEKNNLEILKIYLINDKEFFVRFYGGEVEFSAIKESDIYPIIAYSEKGSKSISFSKEGNYFLEAEGAECLLLPSKYQRDWSKRDKFDPKTLQPFDKVLVCNCDGDIWRCSIFSHIYRKDNLPSVCNGIGYKYCIPYNDDTKHLVGTTDEAPEYYRYWED